MALLDQLVCPHYRLQAIHAEELSHYFLTEEEACPSIIQSPSLVIGGVWVAPDQIAHGA